MKDDKAYLDLMAKYKKLRMDPAKREDAQKALQAALKLQSDGQVSEDASIGAAYM